MTLPVRSTNYILVQMKESGMRADDKLYCRIAYHEQDRQYSEKGIDKTKGPQA